MNAATTRTHDEINRKALSQVESFAAYSFQMAEAAEARGDVAEAEAWYAHMDRLHAEADALRAALPADH
jgi:hypothetical protein